MASPVDVPRHRQCLICKNLFEDLVTNGCGHSSSQRCMNQHISMRNQECPMCQEPVYTKSSVNAALETILQEFVQVQKADRSLYTRETGEIPCDICEENLPLRAVKSCLTCLLSYCERHLKRHQSLRRHRGHKLVSPVERLDEKACRVHGRPLELYCKREKRLICSLCVKTGEDVVFIETERELKEAEKQNTVKGLETMTNQAQIDREQREIKKVFAEVMDVVRRAEEELLSPLEEGRKFLEKKMAEKNHQIEKSNPPVLAEFKDDWTVSIDTELKFGSMRNINSSALASIATQLENLCSFVDVILDEETAHLSLEVSPDGKIVSGPGQFCLVGGILGKLQITSGRAFWVVEVGKKPSWELGVVSENANRRRNVSYKPKEGYWAIVLCDSNLYGAFEDPPLQLHLSTKPQKVGVFVDYEDALVSFYNMDNLSHIYSFTQCDFNETLRPYFNPLPKKDGNDSHPMTICSVNPDDILFRSCTVCS
ncbi:E3 ubiquitin-protein ligase TRIM38-like [Triplophysa dalaica]|uniref:E3 ubiquitin-protein ligase TRIM38-like n=1 Tax=Triplophysa dalaica TaxID=1582913 RepID=UPI0024DF9D4F|nr:E3 ubiquitin-protein ligase TRIM38-like [Triplophysa dalaica]